MLDRCSAASDDNGTGRHAALDRAAGRLWRLGGRFSARLKEGRQWLGRLVGHHPADRRHILQPLDDRVIARHQRLAIGKPVRSAVPRLDAAEEVVRICEAVEVLPSPERRADFRLHIEP